MTIETDVARPILYELGVSRTSKAWITLENNRTYVEVPYKEIMIEINLEAYKWERVGNLIRIDITELVKPKKKKKKEAHPFGL